jgi:hypothetical protein
MEPTEIEPVTSAGNMIGDRDLAPKRCRVWWDIHGMRLERSERNDLKRALVSGRHYDVGGRAVFISPQPVQRGHTPTVAGLKPREAVHRHRADEVIADPTLVLQKGGGHHRADCVTPPILRTGTTAPVTEKAGDRVGATRLQLATEHITVGHRTSIAQEPATATLWLPRGRRWPADVEALRQVDAELPQERERELVLDALRDRAQAKASGERDDT